MGPDANVLVSASMEISRMEMERTKMSIWIWTKVYAS